jgi:hypothetical protein
MRDNEDDFQNFEESLSFSSSGISTRDRIAVMMSIPDV